VRVRATPSHHGPIVELPPEMQQRRDRLLSLGDRTDALLGDAPATRDGMAASRGDRLRWPRSWFAPPQRLARGGG
jgi:hypothetical protein